MNESEETLKPQKERIEEAFLHHIEFKLRTYGAYQELLALVQSYSTFVNTNTADEITKKFGL